MWNNNKCQCECKKRHVCEKDYTWNPSTWSCENWEYWVSLVYDSTIMCDEIIKSYDKKIKTIATKFIEKKQSVKCKIFIFYLHFY